MTLRSKNVYLKEDPALQCMYERKITIRDLQFWLRRNPKQIPAKLANKMRLITNHM